MSKKLPGIESISIDLFEISEDKDDVFCTIYIICYLNKYFKDQRDEWILIEKKALRWLVQKNINIATYQEAISIQA